MKIFVQKKLKKLPSFNFFNGIIITFSEEAYF